MAAAARRLHGVEELHARGIRAVVPMDDQLGYPGGAKVATFSRAAASASKSWFKIAGAVLASSRPEAGKGRGKRPAWEALLSMGAPASRGGGADGGGGRTDATGDEAGGRERADGSRVDGVRRGTLRGRTRLVVGAARQDTASARAMTGGEARIDAKIVTDKGAS